MEYAPIIVFAFNRLDALQGCIRALLNCSEARDSSLFVFVDGARNPEEEPLVASVRDYVKSIKGFKELSYSFSEKNRGLGPSVIQGVTDVINRYGKAVIVEDDLLVEPHFLTFVNRGLEVYRAVPEVFSVCGYTNRVTAPKGYAYDAYFAPRSSSWGWATWADRWNTVDWELKNWESLVSQAGGFNRWGGSDCFGMLAGWHEGKNKSWAIRFCFAQFLQKKLSLFPMKSLVVNDGFDGRGSNCKRYSRFKYERMDASVSVFAMPEKAVEVPSLRRQALAYHSLTKRIWSRLMYSLQGLQDALLKSSN